MDLSSDPASTDDATQHYPATWLPPGQAANDDHYTPTLTVGEVLALAPPRCRDPLAHVPDIAGLAERLILAFPPLIARGTRRVPAVLVGFPELTAAILRRLPPEQRIHVRWLSRGTAPFSLPLDAIFTPLSSAERIALALPHQELLLGTSTANQVQIAALLNLSTSAVCRQMRRLDAIADAANNPTQAMPE